MSEPVLVADSGPLIGLARIRQLHLLEVLASKVLIPVEPSRAILPGGEYRVFQ